MGVKVTGGRQKSRQAGKGVREAEKGSGVIIDFLVACSKPTTRHTAHGTTTNTYNNEDQLVRTWTGDTASSLNGGIPTTENVYTYDTLGRLATVTQTWREGIDIVDETTSYTYDLNGNLATQVTQWNNVVSDYDYDEMNRLTHLTHFVDSDGDRILNDMSEQTLAQFDYSYLADGTRSQAVETDDLGDVTTITWEYDDLNRLVSETSQSTNDDRDYTDQFTYDLSSNRLTQTHTTLSDVVTTGDRKGVRNLFLTPL
jgi:hypothetical protein